MAGRSDPLISFVVQKLCNFLVEKAMFLGAVDGQVEEMKTELMRMQCLLEDADKRQGEATIKNLVAEIRKLVHDAEDVIADYVVKVASPSSRTGRFFWRCVTRHDVGKEIEDINKKINSLRNHLQAHGVVQSAMHMTSSEGSSSTNLRMTYAHVVEEDIVGIEDGLKAVVGHLKNRYTDSRFVSIWGMGGLGKTTFAKEICNHGEVKHYFDRVAWACVSQQFNPGQVWKEILIGLDNPSDQERERIAKLEQPELLQKLYSLQNEKKCLVILDDIWTINDWDGLRPGFPATMHKSGSKIVLTTRNKKVALHADPYCFLADLKLLTKSQSMELLVKKLNQRKQGCRLSTEMKNLGKEMVGHCGGLPLAIVTLGGLLVTKNTLEEWERVSRDVSNLFGKSSVLEGGVEGVLALSYKDLPYHLKACFLYLSLFPEDFLIDSKRLVQMWIAEGFLSGAARGEGTRSTMLDVGMSYLDELVNRCMVEAKITRFTRKVRYCRLHDLMWDFCQKKALEENFCDKLHLQHSVLNTSQSSSSSRIHRFAVNLDDFQQRKFSIPHRQHEHVRSCLVRYFYGDQEMKYWDKINSLIKGFKFLKVFNLVGIRDTCDGKLSKDIGKLVHLRYLSLQFTEGTRIELPSSLGKLILLQTLDLRSYPSGTNFKCRVPDVLWKLKELRHLYLPGFFECTSKLRLDGLSKLETLVNFGTCRSDIGSLATLPNLRNLSIQCAVNELAKVFEYPMFSESNSLLRRSTFGIRGAAETQEEHNLLCRVLACHRVLKFSLHGLVHVETSFLDKLNIKITSIDLEGCGLKEDPMPVLKHICSSLLSFRESTGTWFVNSSKWLVSYN